ncbi:MULTISPECIES: hypothetical protein [unclassified Crossiella]|uniref:hypothetical protein n=1 Tax=unclassified Crossiella TaxID=2620835 RepID=UPI001FFE62F3|nr:MULTISPECIES: hypothetical protein [unclassified Crossiella]MCK2243628.1 hypothetical protein [Crossiella sp. S99.2]MCK2257486.1 hypothetical protein [Crossiella sp. S99.1]
MVEAQPMRLVIRCAAAAAVGASVVLLWLAVLPLLPSSCPEQPCDQPRGWVPVETLTSPGVVVGVVALLAVTVGWWLLGLLQVAGNGLIALLGPVLVLGLIRIGGLVGYTPALPSVETAVLAAVSYLLAALLTEKTVPWLFRAIAAAVLVVAAALGG